MCLPTINRCQTKRNRPLSDVFRAASGRVELANDWNLNVIGSNSCQLALGRPVQRSPLQADLPEGYAFFYELLMYACNGRADYS